MSAQTEKYLGLGLAPLALLSAVVALLLASIVYVVIPLWDSMAERWGRLQRYKTLISAENSTEMVLKEMKARHDSLTVKLDSYTRTMSDPDNLSGVLQLLVSKAREADITFVKIEPQKADQNQNATQYPVLLQMRTTYHSLGQFISTLEAMPQAMTVTRLAVTAYDATRIDVNALVTCYFKNGAESAGAGGDQTENAADDEETTGE